MTRRFALAATPALALSLALAAGAVLPARTALAQAAAPTATPATPGTGGAATMSNPSAAMAGHSARPGSMAPATSAMAPASAAPVDINTATAAQLDALPQIGAKRAAAIIAHRPYKTTDELVSKKAISAGIYSKIKARITAS